MHFFLVVGLLTLLFPASSFAHNPIFHKATAYDQALMARTSAPAPANAFALEGPRWPGRTITYYDATRGFHYKKGVALAIAEWNLRAGPVKFKKVASRARAQFVIAIDPKISLGGLATVGYWGGGQSYWVKLNMRGYQWKDIAWVTSHELGHILGLGHSRGCSVMSYAAYTACKWPESTGQRWMWRCRLQEKDDLAGVRRLYRGVWRLRPNVFCLKNPASAAVTGATATVGMGDVIANLAWNKAARATSYAVMRSAPNGPCATKFNYSGSLGDIKALAYVDTANYYEPIAEGAYCYAIWSMNVDGYVNPASRATVQFTYTLPAIATPSSSTAVLVAAGYSDWQVDLQSSTPAGADSVVAARQVGACPADPTLATFTMYSGYPTSDSLYNGSEGMTPGASVCYRFWAGKYTGNGLATRYSTPVDIWVVLP